MQLYMICNDIYHRSAPLSDRGALVQRLVSTPHIIACFGAEAGQYTTRYCMLWCRGWSVHHTLLHALVQRLVSTPHVIACFAAEAGQYTTSQRIKVYQNGAHNRDLRCVLQSSTSRCAGCQTRLVRTRNKKVITIALALAAYTTPILFMIAFSGEEALGQDHHQRRALAPTRSRGS